MKRKKKNPLMLEHQRPAMNAKERTGNMNHTQYNTKKKEKGRAALIIVLSLLAGTIALNLFVKPEVKADVEYPMCNQHIAWNGR